MCLDMARPPLAHEAQALMPVSTPLAVDQWARALLAHPDRAYARYICEGLQTGFRVGFQRDSPLKSASANMTSATEHPDVIDEYLDKELARGRMLGPFTDTADLPPLQVNRFGVIPKGHNTGKWRLITDLSFPKGRSVNDGIDPAFCSMAYTTVEEVATLAASLGKGTLMAKVDIESAYRLIPVHPQDRPLLAMEWKGKVFIDPMLPFGLRSAPKIFNAVADALNWILHRAGIEHVYHYLDDFIILAPPGSPQCQQALDILDRICQILGIPLAVHKRDGPTTRLTFLGIEIDTVAGQLRLPADKLQRLLELLEKWGDRKTCSRKDLESLIGHLNHACKVVRHGRSFLRRTIDLLHSVNHLPAGTPIRLSSGLRSDVAWWRTFLPRWNGVAFLTPPALQPSTEMASDASGSWGGGAWHTNQWFQVQWGPHSHGLSIAEKELIPIILACDVWGHSWQGHRILCHCDNQVVVAALRSRTSKAKGLMHLLRCLAFVEAQHQCHIQPTYINTKANHLADDLSRDNLASFLSKVPSASPTPAPISSSLLELLLDPQADWISPSWRHQFSSIFRQA